MCLKKFLQHDYFFCSHSTGNNGGEAHFTVITETYPDESRKPEHQQGQILMKKFMETGVS
jgi:hypothetical protein